MTPGVEVVREATDEIVEALRHLVPQLSAAPPPTKGWDAGARWIDLTSRPVREAANRLYRSSGFQLRETNAYRLPLDGQLEIRTVTAPGSASPG